MDSQFEQGGEHLAAEVAAVGQLLLVCPDVLQELIQLLEGLGAGLQHALINLQGCELGYWSCSVSNEQRRKIHFFLSSYSILNIHSFIFYCFILWGCRNLDPS